MVENKRFEIINGRLQERILTPEEIAAMEAANAQAVREYWQNVNYDEAVEAEIHKRYTIGQELSIQRQRDEKPEEFAEYFAFAEGVKEAEKDV